MLNSNPLAETEAIHMGFTNETFPRATHMCYLYNDDQERRQIISQFINAGVENQEFIGYFADIPDTVMIDDYLSEMGIKLPAKDPSTAHPDHYLCQTAKATYFPDNQFRADTMLTKLRHLHHDCCQQATPAIRLTGEMSWASSPEVQGVEHLVEYEARVNLLIETHPLMAICQYDATAFDGETLFKILQVHPLMIVHGQVVHNPYYVPVREYLLTQGLALSPV